MIHKRGKGNVNKNGASRFEGSEGVFDKKKGAENKPSSTPPRGGKNTGTTEAFELTRSSEKGQASSRAADN